MRTLVVGATLAEAADHAATLAAANPGLAYVAWGASQHWARLNSMPDVTSVIYLGGFSRNIGEDGRRRLQATLALVLEKNQARAALQLAAERRSS